MAQNTSHAIMSQRREPHDSLDYFPTPPWATRALCCWLKDAGHAINRSSVHEPACGAGHMSRPLQEYFGEVTASDVHDYGVPGAALADFLLPGEPLTVPDWIITNPPFNLGAQFVTRALEIATMGVAFLTRTQFLETAGRYDGSGKRGDGRGLFKPTPPTEILQFVERVPMFKGRLDRRGTTATSYCWIVWRPRFQNGTRFNWIAPCRNRLERAEDYE